MEDNFYWNVFKNVGSVDSYLLLSEHDKYTKEGTSDGTDKDGRAHTEGHEFK